MRASATDILRRYVVERHMREAVRSVNLDGDPTSNVPRLTESAWVDHVQLCQDVDPDTLRLLGVYYVLAKGSVDRGVIRAQATGKTVVATNYEALALTLAEAAAIAGLNWDYAAARKKLNAATASITARLCARAERGDEWPVTSSDGRQSRHSST